MRDYLIILFFLMGLMGGMYFGGKTQNNDQVTNITFINQIPMSRDPVEEALRNGPIVIDATFKGIRRD